MEDEEHWRALERIYLNAPTNEYYRPTIRVGRGESEVQVEARPDFHHAAGAVHGSVYFKLLDDAAFFAANSLVRDYFVLTSDFTVHLLRPVATGTLVGRGHVVNARARQFVAESQLFDENGTLLAHEWARSSAASSIWRRVWATAPRRPAAWRTTLRRCHGSHLPFLTNERVSRRGGRVGLPP
jgi:uncharacterized protein (TIGR00369 family)